MRTCVLILVFSLGLICSAEVWAGEPRLEGINYDKQNPKESFALLNGELLKAGQTIEGYEVVSVEPLDVQLKDVKTGKTTVLNMNKEFEKAPPKPKAAKPGQKNPADVFNLFQQKVLENSSPSGAQSVKRANFYSSLLTAAKGLVPINGPAGDFQNFMNAFFRGNFSEAETFVEPNSAAASLLKTKISSYTSCTAEYGKRFSHASYQVESENKKSETEIELQILQTVRGDVPGVTSTFGVAAVLYSHTAVLVKKEDGWKVKSFRYKPESAVGVESYWLCVD